MFLSPGADYVTRADPAGDYPFPGGRIRPDQEADGPVRPPAQTGLRIHLGHQDAAPGQEQPPAPGRVHGPYRMEGPLGLLPIRRGQVVVSW